MVKITLWASHKAEMPRAEGKAHMLFQVRRILFNCGSSKGRAKLFPRKDTFKTVMICPKKQFWIAEITPSQDGPRATTRHWDRGSRERLYEFAWTVYIAWCLTGDFFLSLYLNLRKPARFFLCLPLERLECWDTTHFDYWDIQELRTDLFAGGASTSHFSAKRPHTQKMFWDNATGNLKHTQVKGWVLSGDSSGDNSGDNTRGARHGAWLGRYWTPNPAESEQTA